MQIGMKIRETVQEKGELQDARTGKRLGKGAAGIRTSCSAGRLGCAKPHKYRVSLRNIWSNIGFLKEMIFMYNVVLLFSLAVDGSRSRVYQVPPQMAPAG